MKTKVCNTCREEKPLDEFGKRKDSKDGCTGRCKSCRNRMVGERYKENPSKIRERNRKYKRDNRQKVLDRHRLYNMNNVDKLKSYYDAKRADNPEKFRERNRKYALTHPEKDKESKRKYRENNKDKERAYKRIYREVKKEQIKQRNRAYRKNNAERKAIDTQRYRSLKRKLPSTFTLEEWNETKRYFQERCAYCGRRAKLTRDHFIAVNRGGGYTKDNILPACSRCNCSKHANAFEEWYPKQNFYSKERDEHITHFLTMQKHPT